jgi:hypothetical protein
VKKLLPLLIVLLPVMAILGLVWALEFHDRASASEVTKAAYARFGSGPRIVCVSQDRNDAKWNCISARWGDTPNCRQATVSVTGSISFADQTVVCEG